MRQLVHYPGAFPGLNSMKRLGVFLQFTTWMRVHTGGNPAMDKHTIQAGAEILLAALCFRGRHKALRPRASWD